ncbi:DUF6545 domain-containing protein [Streptomyces sp. NPDC090053]|uniref:DUF6545 domain-containing protein n=1 Tax=Streptomyces sp. NPDC090053 TaxID=3365932 RepID=UPI0038236754
MIEIQDGLLALRPYMDPAVTASARQAALLADLSGRALQAAVQATVLSQALRAKRAEPGLRVAEAPVTQGPYMRKSGDYATEVAWLLSVARAFSKIPSPRKRRSS